VNATTINECYTALHLAASASSLDIVKLPLQHEGDLDAKGERGETPLGISVQKGDEKIVACLVDAKHYRGRRTKR
jgi:ankyrin repeat protein